MTDPAKYSKEEREEGSVEQEASKKLEETLKEGDGENAHEEAEKE